MARGTFDALSLAQAIAPGLRPKVDRVDLASPEWREREVLPLDKLINSIIGKGELKITATWVQDFNPMTVAEVNHTTGMIYAITNSQDEGGFLFKAGTEAYHFRMPALETFEQRLEEMLDFTPLVPLEEEFDEQLDYDDSSGDNDYD